MESMNDILAVIMGGGKGSRLYPLTKLRSKPAVPMAGKYRLIDIPISNCINSGIYRIAVLTQFNSVSLHRHIARTYQFDAFHVGWVQIWAAAEQTMSSSDWYQGTADAVRKQLFEIKSARAAYTLILAGDHLYRMDYDALARFHWDHNADITVAVQGVPREEAPRLGLLKRNEEMRITSFAEKPKEPAAIDAMVSRDDPARPLLGSMGIYLFKTEVLAQLLQGKGFDDFGGQVIPHAINTGLNVFGYEFDGFWADIGTIRSFYEANLMLTRTDTPFDFHDQERPIYSRSRFLPGSIVTRSTMEEVLLAEGCRIEDAEIRHSIVGLRSQIRSGVRVTDSILMGADYYERPSSEAERKQPPLGIDRNCIIEGAIIDKNASLGEGVVIKPFPRGTEIETENWAVQDGIVVVPKNAVILPGTVIAPE